MAQPAQAVGFGRVATATQLGEPLNFSAAVRLEADESLTRDCVFAEVTAGETRVAPSLVRVALEGNPGDLDRSVRVTTATPIDEPVVAVSVTIGCTAKVTRRFVAFIDPPGTNLAQAASTDALPTAPGAERETAMPASPRQAPVRPGPPRPMTTVPPATRATPRVTDAAPRVAAAVSTAEVTERRAPAPRRAVAGPRLQLEAPTLALGPKPAASAPAPVSVAAVTEPAAASAPAQDLQAELLALQRQRIASLEDEVRRLRADAAARQQAMLTVKTNAPMRRSERYANPLVCSLVLLCFLLTILVCGFLGRRARDRAAARWKAAMAFGGSQQSALPRPVETAAPAESIVESALPVVEPAPVEADPPLHRTSPLALVRTAAPADAAVRVVAEAPAPRVERASSVEELIDLEQQVDFFVVLGQEDAAIELLTSRIAQDPGGSPLPLLKLLEIHRRLGDRQSHDRVLAQVARDFNVSAPAWEADPVQGRPLESYPDVVARLQALWPKPVAAIAFLDNAVSRRGSAVPAFDLPAYRELLFLHSIARDHAGRATPEAVREVDLLLPLDVSTDEAPIARLSASRSGTPEFDDSALLTAPLDLDVSFESPRPAPAQAPRLENLETVPAALRRPPDYSNESAFVDFEIDLPGALTPAPRR